MNDLSIFVTAFVLSFFAIWLICGPKRPYGAKKGIEADPHKQTGDNSTSEAKTAAPTSNGDSAIDEGDNTEQQAKTCRECWTLSIEVLGLIGLFAYAYVTFQMWRDTHNQFRMDQRPYILVQEPKDSQPQFLVGNRARWDAQFVNYGKSPSVKAYSDDIHLWVGKSARDDMNAFFARLPDKPPTMTSYPVPPNSSATAGQPGFAYTTILSDGAVTPDGLDFMRRNNYGAILAGRIWYSDIFGDVHRTDFCRFTLVTGAIGMCQEHNDLR